MSGAALKPVSTLQLLACGGGVDQAPGRIAVSPYIALADTSAVALSADNPKTCKDLYAYEGGDCSVGLVQG